VCPAAAAVAVVVCRYWVSAAAAVAAEDPAWYQQNLAPYVNALVRDYANNDKSDPYFAYARHKDW
jgi:endoglucanase Acf2